MFAANPDPHQPFQPPVGLDGRREIGASAFGVGSAHGLRPFFAAVYRCMAALGLPRDTFMHEMGISQFEINFPHGDALRLADQTFLFKHLLREVALEHGLLAVCMAKPLGGVPGSSMHIHQSVLDADGRNIFSDARGAPSAAFGHFIAGLQATLAEFTALLAPNVNAYQRLAQPCASPNNACWAYDNRAAGLRIPASAPVDRRVRTACRAPTPIPTWRWPPASAPACTACSPAGRPARRCRGSSPCRKRCACRPEWARRCTAWRTARWPRRCSGASSSTATWPASSWSWRSFLAEITHPGSVAFSPLRSERLCPTWPRPALHWASARAGLLAHGMARLRHKFGFGRRFWVYCAHFRGCAIFCAPVLPAFRGRSLPAE